MIGGAVANHMPFRTDEDQLVKTSGHQQAGFLCGVSTGLILSLPTWECLTLGVMAVFSSGGSMSPDMDLKRTYRMLLPKKLEGHRRLTHWWGFPVIALMMLLIVCLLVPNAPFLVILFGLWIGWASHLLIDFVFGAPGWGRRAGIPMTPLGNHRGLLGTKRGLYSDGRAAKITQYVILPALNTLVFIILGIKELS